MTLLTRWAITNLSEDDLIALFVIFDHPLGELVGRVCLADDLWVRDPKEGGDTSLVQHILRHCLPLFLFQEVSLLGLLDRERPSVLELPFEFIGALRRDRADLVSVLDDSDVGADLNAVWIDVSTDDTGHSVGVERRLTLDDVCMCEGYGDIALIEVAECEEGLDVIVKIAVIF